MRIRKILCLFVVFSFIRAQQVPAQISVPYNFSYAPQLVVADTATPVNGYPILFNPSSDCLVISNGLLKFSQTAKGLFVLGCAIETISYEFICYPNPAKSYVIVRMPSASGLPLQKWTIEFWGMNGVKYLSGVAGSAALATGFRYNLPLLSSGIYVLTVRREDGQIIASKEIIVTQ